MEQDECPLRLSGPSRFLLIAWCESETSPGTEDQEAPPYQGAEASLGEGSKIHLFSFLAKIGLRPPGSQSALVGKGSHWSVAGYPPTLPGLVKGGLVVRGKATGPGVGRYPPLSSVVWKGGSGALCPPPTPARHLIPSWIL